VVGEFPELQGYMGMTYANISGEENDVASAIYEHYMPRFAGDSLPSEEIGTIVSLSDKLDNIASFFYLDMIPSGSEDPFALRRQAAGVIHILQTVDYPDSLNSLITASLKGLKFTDNDIGVITTQIVLFFHQRLESILLSEGHSHDVIDSALSTLALNLKDIKYRINIISELKRQDSFPALLIAAKRVYNILKEDQNSEVNESLFVEDAEKKLFSAANNVKDELLAGNFNQLFKLEKPIDIFFEKVLVMDKDDQIKENRLALLSYVRELFDSFGDFSKIVE
jgi:glycyl-tRNA synthetase beta chain